ncbi:unnamed protein product [Caenorhabditis angaria]|uniref:Uncharacterized protein n=1 Tax=Caenorhabditis angaria TaxID=860376 RepID=A0A9P1I9R3_9PELO|nr:unnamed protein product [Caenorhabditis angaria]
MVLTFSDSIMKLKRNTAWTKIEDGKTEKELISKYFQIIVENSIGKFSQGEKINSTQCGFLDQDTILSITGRISIHGVSVDGEILKLKEMKAKKITFRHITGHLLHREIFKYFIDFEMDIRTIAELQKEMHSDYEDEEEDYDYDYEELKENKDIKCLLKELRRNYNGLPFQDHFEISNETHKIKVECERNSFTMSQI